MATKKPDNPPGQGNPGGGNPNPPGGGKPPRPDPRPPGQQKKQGRPDDFLKRLPPGRSKKQVEDALSAVEVTIAEPAESSLARRGLKPVYTSTP